MSVDQKVHGKNICHGCETLSKLPHMALLANYNRYAVTNITQVYY